MYYTDSKDEKRDMPTYEYRCACGVRIETVHKMTEEPIIECPSCLIPMTKVPNFGTSIFRGKGFYKNGG